MNICMFTNTYLPHVGGVARSVAFFAEDLRKLGQRVLVVAPSFQEESAGDEDQILRVPAIQNFNGSDFSLRISIPFVIGTRIQEFQPDIIHSHHPYLLGDAAFRIARRLGIPMVFTHHTMYEHYTHYVPIQSESMKQFVINLSTEYANLSDGVIAPSNSVAQIIRERGVTTPVEEIPTGVDIDFFQRGDGARFRNGEGIPSDEWVVGHVGRLAPEKNLAYLGEAAARFLKEHSGRFLVVGAGPSEGQIRQIFQEQGLSGRLHLAGKKSGEGLADAYKAMDLFVFSSKTETQGMVLVEAMAAGLPVVALDAPGVREVMRDGVNGRLLPETAPPEDFAEAVQSIARDRRGSEHWEKGARETASRFSRDVCARRLLNWYELLRRNYTGTPAAAEEYPGWEKLRNTLKAEWDLISEKMAASKKVLDLKLET